MNERIKELIALCQEYRPGFEGQEAWYTVFNKQKFAELIINKCIEIDIDNPDARPGVEIARYFGVKL